MGAVACDCRIHQIHTGRADEITHKGMGRGFKQLFRRAHLHHTAVIHDNNLIGEGERLGLVVGDVDHGMAKLAVQLLKLGAQLPFHVRVDHGEGFVKQNGVDVFTHHAAPKTDLLLGIRRQPARLAIKTIFHADHLCNMAHPRRDIGRIHATVAQGEGKVFTNRHRVIDHGKLENLRDVARSGFLVGDIAVAKQHTAMAGPHHARDDVQQGRLAAARRPKQRIGPAVLPDMVHFL